MKTLILSLIALTSPFAAQAGTCKAAIDKAIKEHGEKFEVISTNFMPVGPEGKVEVTSLVLTWWPRSETRSEYYYLISATCQPTDGDLTNLNKLELYDDMPSEGGVTVKTVTKARM